MHITIFGGGVAGAHLARELSDDGFQITLVDPKDYFEVPMAAPRALVKPEFAQRSTMRYADFLPGVKHVQASLTTLKPATEGKAPDAEIIDNGGTVSLLPAGDLAVLCTGTAYGNPVLRADRGSQTDRITDFSATHDQLKSAKSVLIIGGGPIGVEIAGEIIESLPGIKITIAEMADRILAGTSAKAAKIAADFLTGHGVEILTGAKLTPDHGPDGPAIQGPGIARGTDGGEIPYDAIIWCIGGRPNTGFMAEHFADALNAEGRIRVAPNLLVAGQSGLMAIGDITDLDENKMAWHVAGAVKTAARNIRTLAKGASADTLKSYKPKTGDPSMVVTLGAAGGVAHLPLFGVTTWSWLIRNAKSAEMLVPKFRKMLGVGAG